MDVIELGTRFTGNGYAKITHISKTKIRDQEGYKFYSSYDECNYLYPSYKLSDAIKAYEKDTWYQRFSEVHYFTTDEEIAEEYRKLEPWI